VTVETETAPQAQADDHAFTSDAEGLRAAADEVIKKRSAETDEITGPGNQSEDRGAVDPKEAIKLSEGKKALLDWRKEREAKRAAFEAAVFGEQSEEAQPAEGEDGEPPSVEQQYQRARDALTQLEGELGITKERDQTAEAKTRLAELEQVVQQQAAAHALAPIETQLQQHIQARTAQATQHMLQRVLEIFPEASDPQVVSQLHRTDPARFAALVEACQQADAEIAKATTVAQAEAVTAAHAHQQQWAYFAHAEDQVFNSRHPELAANPQAKQAVAQGAIDYLRSLGMSDGEIQTAWNSPQLRSAKAQEVLLEATRAWLAKKNLANRPRKEAPRLQRPGAAGEVAHRPDPHIELSKRLDRSGSVRDAARLLVRRRQAARRR
jgi:hypothetical protein